MNELYPQLFYRLLFNLALFTNWESLGRWAYLQQLKHMGCNLLVFDLARWKTDF